MTPLKPWQLIALLTLVILVIIFLLRYSRSQARHEGVSPHASVAATKWVQR